MIHHPPVRGAVPAAQAAVRHRPLPRHGHQRMAPNSCCTAIRTCRRCSGSAARQAPMPVVGVAAAGQAPGGNHPGAQYNLIEIDGEAGDWRLQPDAARRRPGHDACRGSCRRWTCRPRRCGVVGREGSAYCLIAGQPVPEQDDRRPPARRPAPAITSHRPEMHVIPAPPRDRQRRPRASRDLSTPATAGSTLPSIMRSRSTMRSAI